MRTEKVRKELTKKKNQNREIDLIREDSITETGTLSISSRTLSWNCGPCNSFMKVAGTSIPAAMDHGGEVL